jgi:steroid 5-alpha reductase family enzyme
LSLLFCAEWPSSIGASAVLLLHSSLLLTWAGRLGSFLFARIQHNGGIDSRFDRVRTKPLPFLIYWSIQGVWVGIVALPVLLVHRHADFSRAASLPFAAGVALWLMGISVEAIADAQKIAFRNDARNKNSFIQVTAQSECTACRLRSSFDCSTPSSLHVLCDWRQTGLWRYSRHPNYAGEIVLWSGVALSACALLPTLRLQALSALSPLFIALLLVHVSGIPILEKQAYKRWGDTPEYKAYVARTSVLFPGLPSVGAVGALKAAPRLRTEK